MRASEFITEDRESMLKYIRTHYSQWDLEEFQQELDRLAQLDIDEHWKGEIHNLILKTAEASNLIPWKQEFNGFRNLIAIRNISKKLGYVTTILGFLIHRLKIKIAATEELSPAGFNWLKTLLLAGGRGFKIIDQTGQYPDIVAIEKEWNRYMKVDGTGPTEIMFENNTNRIFETKASNTRLMPCTYYKGDTRLL